mgnify:CR=1 FL=1
MAKHSKKSRRLSLPERCFYGSRFRCLLLTHQGRRECAHDLSKIISPHGEVSSDDLWMPNGFTSPQEAELRSTDRLVDSRQCKLLQTWWLAVKKNPRTPSWDIASRAAIKTPEGNRPGILLVEAKAHEGESKGMKDVCDSENSSNRESIASAIHEANTGLANCLPGRWALSPKSHYQLANRFAFSWKLAELGVPVVLVYLGFLNASEMENGKRKLWKTHDDWERWLRDYSKAAVPESVWGNTVMINGTPFTPLIRSLDLNWHVGP